MAGLSHITKFYAIVDLEAYQVVADWAPLAQPAAPAAPTLNALTGTGAAGGAVTWTYQAYLSNGLSSIASANATTAVGAAILTNNAPITITLSVTPAAGVVATVVRTAGGAGVGTGVLGRIMAGSTSINDVGAVLSQAFVADVGTAYGPKIKVAGSKSLAVTQTIDNKELRGDFALLDADVVVHDITAAITFAKRNFDFDALALGGVVVDSGATPNRISTYSLSASSKPLRFKLEAQCVAVDPVAGDAHIVLPRTLISAPLTLGFAEENYEMGGVSVRCVPRFSDALWMQEVLNETATSIAA